MGADIHFYVEKKIDGKWQMHGTVEREDSGDDGEWMRVCNGFSDYRCYNAFAILAGVRNGSGFAGIKTGKGFNPISEPRGIPEDASDEYKQIAAQWGVDGHSHSYHTLRQLLDYDWMQETQLQDWTDVRVYLDWVMRGKQTSGPESYCGGVSGPDIKHLAEDEAAELVEQYRSLPWSDRKQFDFSKYANNYVLAKWQVNYAEASRYIWSDTVPRLLSLAGGLSGADDVRIVFFFDN